MRKIKKWKKKNSRRTSRIGWTIKKRNGKKIWKRKKRIKWLNVKRNRGNWNWWKIEIRKEYIINEKRTLTFISSTRYGIRTFRL